MRVCVYTSIFGRHDLVKDHVPQDIEADFFLFTDSEAHHVSSAMAIVRDERFAELDSRMRAKLCKILPQLYFDKRNDRFVFKNSNHGNHEYDYIVYIDGSIKIKNPNFLSFLSSLEMRSGWAMVPHPERCCIYDELDASLWLHPQKYGQYPIIEQVEKYRADGHPEKFGLYAAGIIARNAKNPLSPLIDMMWWQETLEWSPQDQISLMHVLRKAEATVDKIPVNLWTNDYFDWIPHVSTY